MTIGIYKITNKLNDKSYIGLSKNIERRFKEHIKDCKFKKYAISNAIEKYGKDNFTFEIVEECSLEKLEKRERYWINKLKTQSPNGYNLTNGGEKSKIYSKESREKMSNSQNWQKGKNNPFYGKKHSEETKKIIGEKAKKRFENPEYRKKLSDSHKGLPAWNKGIDHIPQEQRRINAQSFSKKVFCIELKKEFASITAALRFLESQGKSAKSRANIKRNIDGGSPAYGYNWKYIN